MFAKTRFCRKQLYVPLSAFELRSSDVAHLYLILFWKLYVLCSGWLGYFRQWTEWRRAGEKKENLTGTAGCTLMIALLLPSDCFCTLLQHAFPSTFIWLYWSYHPGRTVWDNTVLCSGMCYTELHTLTWLLIWYRENLSAIRLCFCCFCWLQVFF